MMGRPQPFASKKRSPHNSRGIDTQDRILRMPEPEDLYLELSTRGGPAVRLDLRGDRLTIGRAPEADIPLDSTKVSRQHAELQKSPDGHWTVHDLNSRNGTRVNGRPVNEQVLQHGDRIHIGDFEFRFRSRSAPLPAGAEIGNTMWSTHGGSTTVFTTLMESPATRLKQSHLAFVSGLSAKLVDITDAQERMTQLCRALVESEVRCDEATVLRVDRNDPQTPPEMLCPLQLRSTAGQSAGTSAPTEISRAIVEAAISNEQPILAGGDHEAQGRACIVCPLQVETNHADILYVLVPREHGTVDWLALVALAAEQFKKAQLQIEARQTVQASAELHHDLKKAQQMQMSLVPKNPAVPGLEVSIGFEPCRWIGGDYANVVSGPDGKVLLAVADASGKGLAAAMIASGVHSIVHSAIRAGSNLEDMVQRLNQYLLESMDRQSFVTFIGVMLDPRTGDAVCINAGHPPMLVVDPDGNVTEMPFGHNPPLGVLPMAVQLDAASLEPGQLILLYTDGLSELRDNCGKMLGLDGISSRISKLYAADPNAPLKQLCEKLNQSLDEIRGNCPSTDDRTFLMARRENPAT
jgi:sigma-B regulation protein RsbU (phosphoserine phosphatase)